MSERDISGRIVAGLDEFHRKLEAGEPLKATRVTRVNTPDGPMHLFDKIVIGGESDEPEPDPVPSA